MAYTVSRENTVFGNKRAVFMTITADAATQAIETGLQKVDFIGGIAVLSATTLASMHFAINSNASGVQSYGVIGMSGLTSGDLLHITVFGR
jgi:hypothetical protein